MERRLKKGVVYALYSLAFITIVASIYLIQSLSLSKRLDDKMSDEQKYEIVFDWMVNYFKYDYATLYSTQATNLALEANSKFGKIIRQNRSKIENFTELDDIEKAKALISLFQGNKEYAKLCELKQKEIRYREKEKQFKTSSSFLKVDSVLVIIVNCEILSKESKS